MVQSIRTPATPPLANSPSQSERTRQAPPRPPAPPPGSSARARDGMRNQGNRTSKNLHQAFNSGAAPAPAPAEPKPAHPEGIAEKMSELETLEKERADLGAKQDGLHSPSAKLKAKELDVRIAMLADHILAEMKMIADISKRANQIATSAV